MNFHCGSKKPIAPQRKPLQWAALLSVSAIILSGCNTATSDSKIGANSSSTAMLAGYPGIKAFRDVCLGTLPSFKSATNAASRYGIKDYLPMGPAKLGMKADKSLGVQIELDRECAVTTPKFKGSGATLRAEFIQAVSAATGRTVKGTSVPFAVEIGGQRFIFMHDRRGGEAFVVLRAK